METMPMWVIILVIGIVGGIFSYALRIFLNNFYDSRPIMCDMCGKWRGQIRGNCPHCGQKLSN